MYSTVMRLLWLLLALLVLFVVATHPAYVPARPECNTTIAPTDCPTQGP